MKPGFTPGMEEERDRRRKVLLSSILMESTFSASDVSRLLSDHKSMKPVSTGAAKAFLITMEEDGLVSMIKGVNKVRWCRKRISLGVGKWVKQDNGIRLGAYFP